MTASPRQWQRAEAPPPLLKVQRRPTDSLDELAKRSLVRARERGFSIQRALERDGARFSAAGGPAWGLTGNSLPEVLAIGRIADDRRKRKAEPFIGLLTSEAITPAALELLLRGSAPIVNKQLVTCYGETVCADVLGLLLSAFIESGSGAPSPLRAYLSPRRAAPASVPEVFTWSSVFNNAFDGWPAVAGIDQLRILHPEQQRQIVDDCLAFALEALAAESEHHHVQLAAGRLYEMSQEGGVEILVSECGAAEPAPLLTFEATERRKRHPTLNVSLQWVAAALEQEIIALTHLVRVASLARDWYFNFLNGTKVFSCRELNQVGEIQLHRLATTRADGLAGEFLREAAAYDTRFQLRIHRDAYCVAVERHPGPLGLYEDP